MLGLFTAAVFTPTLSAPAFKKFLASATVLIPPATIIGIKTFSPTFFTKSSKLFLPYKVATVSIYISSSIPSE